MSFTRDATSNRPIPQSAAEFTSFLSGSGIANPFMACMFNQVSGACIDLIGSNNMTVAGPFAGPGFQNPVTGWSSTGVLFHNGNNDGATATGGTLPDVATASCLVFTWSEWIDPGAATVRSHLGIGTRASSPQHSLSASPSHDTVKLVTNVGSITSAAGWVDGAVHGVLLQLNRDVANSGANQAQTITSNFGQMSIPVPFNTATLTQGQEIRIGNADFGSGNGVAGGQTCIYMCAWKGTAAELSLTQLTTLKNLWYDIVPPIVAVAGPYWGPHYPDAAGTKFFYSTLFPDGQPSATLIPGTSPAGVATLVLGLETGTSLTMSWTTDIIKTYSGKETRAAIIDSPKMKWQGGAYITGNATRQNLTRLARYAAIGSAFALAIPYEELTLTGSATSKTLPVRSTTSCDWMVVGQRVVLVDPTNLTSLDAVIQSFTSSTVTIDVSPGALGVYGARLMPKIAVYLDPQQGFTRFAATDAVEMWQLNATAAIFGYQTDARAAQAALSAATGAMIGLVVSYATAFSPTGYAGTVGNGYSLTLVADGSGAGSVSTVSHAYTYHYQTGVTTAAQVITGLTGLLAFSGTYTPAATLTAGDAVSVTLATGLDKDWGSMGVGATLTTYDSRPVWDRPLMISQGSGDSLQSLSEMFDLGGIPLEVGTADVADWGRSVGYTSSDAAEWQWVKLFLSTVKGRQKAFWLSTQRPDLLWVGTGGVDPITGGNYMLIQGPGDAYGGIDAWYPSQRDRLQIVQTNGVVTYAKINAVIDNFNGTLSLSLSYSSALSGTAVSMLSWLELCHFDEDDFTISFDGPNFAIATRARVVPQ